MKIDLTKKFRDYYQAPKDPEVSSFEAGSYLTIEGSGEPAGKEFTSKVEALYPVAYGVKKICKLRGTDFAVPKLEGLWWVDGKQDARSISKSQWKWKLLIRVPDFVKAEDVATAKEEVEQKKKLSLATSIHFEKLENGKCVHVLHIGPYSDEPKTIDRMHDFINSKGLKIEGLHHEIYLSDPRKTAPKRSERASNLPQSKWGICVLIHLTMLCWLDQMPFLKRVLHSPSYGYLDQFGGLSKPTPLKLLGEFFERVNPFINKKNWLTFTGWFTSLLLAIPFFIFLFRYFSWPLTIIGLLYSMVGLGTYGTVWFHRYATPRRPTLGLSQKLRIFCRAG